MDRDVRMNYSKYIDARYSMQFFFFNDTATTEIYTLSLHDALPICRMYAKGFQEKEGIRLCEGAPFGEYKAPFLFASNGRAYNKDLPEKSGIWFLDTRREENLPKSLRGFYSPRDLQELFQKEEGKANENLKQESIDYLLSKNGLGLRYYQVEAIQAVEEALISGKEKALLTMATGTGKTMKIGRASCRERV